MLNSIQHVDDPIRQAELKKIMEHARQCSKRILLCSEYLYDKEIELLESEGLDVEQKGRLWYPPDLTFCSIYSMP